MSFMGIIAIMVMEGVSEFTQLFPAPNAIMEYVKAFVDEDLGWVVGIAYWSAFFAKQYTALLTHIDLKRFTFSSIFAVENLSAAGLSSYWGLSQTWQIVVFYFLAPVIMLAINFTGVGVCRNPLKRKGVLMLMLLRPLV
jgi:amino acid transporter